MENFRMIRVNELLKRVISEYLRKYFTQEAVAITITKVETAPNLKTAQVYYSVYNSTERKQVLQFLKRVRKEIQFGISDVIRMKYTPQLMFVWDPSLEKAHRTLTLIDQISEELDHNQEDQD